MSTTYSMPNLNAKTVEALEHTDRLPFAHKTVVHEFGYPIYRALIAAGVTRPTMMRQLVREIWEGARTTGGTRNRPQRMGNGGNLSTLDWLLIQSGSALTAHGLVRNLHNAGFVLIPRHPTPQMINASVGTVRGGGPKISDYRKHEMRLRAAIDMAMAMHWPDLEPSKEGQSSSLTPKSRAMSGDVG